jgi:hypothetical protein
MDTSEPVRPSILRLGVGLWLLSWAPIAVIFSIHGNARVAVWTVQVLLGIAGIALAGSAFAAAVKGVGWRHAPGVVGFVFVRGRMPDWIETPPADPAVDG